MLPALLATAEDIGNVSGRDFLLAFAIGAELEARLAATAGLFVAGNGYHGIGIPDCVRMGKQAAEKIAKAG
jgi:2-methylcitrate dehydratase PrpD